MRHRLKAESAFYRFFAAMFEAEKSATATILYRAVKYRNASRVSMCVVLARFYFAKKVVSILTLLSQSLVSCPSGLCLLQSCEMLFLSFFVQFRLPLLFRRWTHNIHSLRRSSRIWRCRSNHFTRLLFDLSVLRTLWFRPCDACHVVWSLML